MNLKQIAVAAIGHQVLLPLLRPLGRGIASVLTLHRFADLAVGSGGHSVFALRACLAYLRRHRYTILSLPELVERLDGGAPLSRAVVFTVDDGCADFHRVALPVFSEFDCPVTVFLCTGFLDGACWLWWDRAAYVLAETRHTVVDVRLPAGTRRYLLGGASVREAAAADLCVRLEQVSEEWKEGTLQTLARDLEVTLPAFPPPRYAPMNWDDVRAGERFGVTFGPHTVTHPILSQVDDVRLQAEVQGSWERLRSETAAAVPIFSFPNGQPFACGEREIAAVRRSGLSAAVTTQPRYIESAGAGARGLVARYTLPRFAYPGDLPHFTQLVTGVERAKQAVRGMLAQ